MTEFVCKYYQYVICWFREVAYDGTLCSKVFLELGNTAKAHATVSVICVTVMVDAQERLL